jgi:hypothetical protein
MTDFKLVNIVDSQLEDITSELTLPVITGASSNNFQRFPSQASTNTSQVQFQVSIPSLSTAVSRNFLCQSTIRVQIDFTGGTTTGYWQPNQVLFSYGKVNSFQAFPLNSLLSTITSNINNANVTVNTRQVMAGLLKMFNYGELAKFNSLTPSLVDSFYQNFADGLGTNNNVIGNYSIGSFTKEFQPRGCFPVKLYTTAGVAINSLQVVADGAGTCPYASIFVDITTTEPLLFLSPYKSGNSNNQASFIGINTINLTMNIGDATRVMSNASYANTDAGVSTQTISNVSLISLTGCELLLNFFTIPPMLYAKIEPKNVLNYNQYTAYNYASTTIPGAVGGVQSSSVVTFNNIQLNQIPSKFLVFARPTTQTTYDSNYFMTITGVSFNFANKSGLLSSASQTQLYDMSVKNGLQMNYYEFSGQGVSNNSSGTGEPMIVPTIGSILCIDPALDLSIDSQYSNMSGGQYNMQFQLTISNQTPNAVTPTLYLVAVNSGLFITENGTSSFMTGLLSQEMVLETKGKDAITDSQSYETEIVGGSIENINSIHKHLKKNYSKATAKEHQLDQEKGESVGGAMSAGVVDMPKRRIHRHMSQR